MIVASAPAKLVLCGEYVVLDGAPAIGIALSARATVTLSAASGQSQSLRCPGLADAEYVFTGSPGSAVRWREDPAPRPDLSLFETQWRNAAAVAGAYDVVIDSSAFCDSKSGSKLGLGSSAAVATALASGLAKLSNRKLGLLAVIEQHRQYQGGSGSGLDVATSWHGGIVSYSMADFLTVSLAWPAGLHCAVFWSGSPVRTTDRIATFSEANRSDPERLKLQNASRTLVESWPHADADMLELLLARYAVQLKKFDAALNLEIFAAGHAAMFEAADEYGVVYKPCGAGGGDIGIALSCDEDNLQNFASAASDLGFTLLDLSLDEVGRSVADSEETSTQANRQR